VQFLDLTVHGWLEKLGESGPAPGGGSAAAITAAMGASLVGMAARLSAESWPEAGGACAQASALSARLAGLAQADADTYTESLQALERAHEIPAHRRDHELGAALDRSAQTPLAIAETAYDVVLVAFEAREHVDPKVQPDVDAAIALASAAAQAAARLVEVNLSATRDDPRVEQARAAAETAARVMRRVFLPA
jgi:formiminotetrahydrofolate cyclodeaminase